MVNPLVGAILAFIIFSIQEFQNEQRVSDRNICFNLYAEYEVGEFSFSSMMYINLIFHNCKIPNEIGLQNRWFLPIFPLFIFRDIVTLNKKRALYSYLRSFTWN
jgi:hypothetical protein